MIEKLDVLLKRMEFIVSVIRGYNLIPVVVQCRLGKWWGHIHWDMYERYPYLFKEIPQEMIERCQEKNSIWQPEEPHEYLRYKTYDWMRFTGEVRSPVEKWIPSEEYTLAGNYCSLILSEMGVKIITRNMFRWWRERCIPGPFDSVTEFTKLVTRGSIKSALDTLQVPADKAVLLASCDIDQLGCRSYKGNFEIENLVVLICPCHAANSPRLWIKSCNYREIKFLDVDFDPEEPCSR